MTKEVQKLKSAVTGQLAYKFEEFDFDVQGWTDKTSGMSIANITWEGDKPSTEEVQKVVDEMKLEEMQKVHVRAEIQPEAEPEQTQTEIQNETSTQD